MTALDYLELRDNNLYAAGGYLNYYADSDEVELLRDTLVINPTEEDEWHTVLYGDNLSKLAWQKYSSWVADASKLWFIIADANGIYDPMDLSEFVGKDILIPNYLKVRLLIT